MPIQWNDDQQRVISHRNGNLVVSAAAGSGKTAVMIERLSQLITDPIDPVDVDELLVVTFTNAAAAEMRNRLTDRLSDILAEEESPAGRARLLLQLQKLKGAQVTTIHSFCLDVIRAYVTRIPSLDPGFRIADETETALLKSDVLEEVLEEGYAFASENPESEDGQHFLHFVDCYSGVRQDAQLEGLLLDVYRFLESQVEGLSWLVRAASAYHITDVEGSPWDAVRQKLMGNKAEAAIIRYRNLKRAIEGAGILKIEAEIDNILANLEAVQNGAPAVKAELSIARMSYTPWKEDAAGRKQIEKLLEAAKKAVGDLLEIQDGWIREEEAERLSTHIYPALQGLCWILERFEEAYSAEKRERGIVDFPDLERFALQILLDEDGSPTREAKEIRERFRYICIDEYQDSNEVQEAVLTSIARTGQTGRPVNQFMVGDVKQSIYKFREARPELFLAKQESYPQAEEADVLFLHQNFRSRAEILHGVNDIFYGLMYKPEGEIDYSEDEALVPGRIFPNTQDPMVVSARPQLTVLTAVDNLRSAEVMEQEARFVAERIQTMVLSGQKILDKDGSYRPVTYRDFVILLRSNKTMAPILQDALKSVQVPSFSEITTGFYQTKEIQCVLNVLRIIDNPLQDIPLTGVLYSPIYNFTVADLGKLRRFSGKDMLLYESLCRYAAEDTVEADAEIALEGIERDPELTSRCRKVLEDLARWRERVTIYSIHDLIWQVLTDTGYYLYASASPDGDRKRANLDLLLKRAIDYETGSFSGLFHFLRYIARMEDQERDEVQARSLSEEENVVRIMSIHKSKGLEFPIVFLCSAGYGFNFMDLRGRLLLHPELGIGAQEVDAEAGFYYETLPHRAIAARKKQETIAEEMRVLYVALTRAQQGLFVTGYMKNAPEAVEPCRKLSSDQVLSAGSMLDWLLPLALHSEQWDTAVWTLTAEEESAMQAEEEHAQEAQTSDHAYYDELEERFSWIYPYAWRDRLPARLSVSQLKKAEADEHGQVLHVSLPEEDENAGARAGTAIHKVLSLLDLTRVEEATAQLKELQVRGDITEQEASDVPGEQMELFGKSALARRMRDAVLCLREQPFIIQMPMSSVREIVPGWMEDLPQESAEEQVMIQGIIDCCFMEDAKWVIADYKSDRILDKKRLTAYGRQLRLYRYALQQITGEPVKELLLYATRTGREIDVALENAEGRGEV